MPLPFTVRRTDSDAAAFCARSGASDVSAIDAFVKGVKDLGLWNSMVCWPLRRSQNSGTNTAFSLGGLGAFDGTLVNGPTWGTSGILFDAATNTHITTPLDVIGLRKFTAMVATEQRALVNVSTGDGVISAWGSTANQNYFVVRKAALTNVQGIVRSAGATRTLSVGSQTADWRVYGWGTQGANTILTASGAQIGTQAFLPEETSSQTLNIGILATPNNSPYDGTIAWAMFYKDNELTTAQQLSVYTLYRNTLGTGLGLPDYDPATIEYAARSGATDLANIDAFVRGVKDLGLWESMVCWPLRSTQNAGTGTTAYSLGGLGTFNGTLRGGPSWGTDGVILDGSDDRITTTHSVSNSPKLTLWAVGSSTATSGALIAAVETFEVEGFYISTRKAAIGQYQYRTQITPDLPASSINGTNTSISGFASVGLGVQGATTVATVNGISDGSGAYVPNRTGTGPVTIGGQVVTSTNSVTLPYNGTIAFAMSFVGSTDGISTAQQLALHNLYKQTLGTGLGLP
jgi:hypothetical protein